MYRLSVDLDFYVFILTVFFVRLHHMQLLLILPLAVLRSNSCIGIDLSIVIASFIVSFVSLEVICDDFTYLIPFIVIHAKLH